MHLAELLNGLKCETVGNLDLNIESLACSTEKVKKNCMFFCLVGQNFDGHDLVLKAVGDGAVCIVCQKKLNVNVAQIIVENSRIFMARVAKTFYSNASDSLKIIGIVGTNGKTSCSYILDSIFTCAGKNCAVIGTNGVCFANKKHFSSLTTPDPIELHKWFFEMKEHGVEYVFLEISAHAIFHGKLEGMKIDCVLFTNFSQDHLDFFQNMENYAKVKMSFFNLKNTKNAVVNLDDDLGKKIASSFENAVTYSLHEKSDVIAHNVSCENNGNKFEISINGGDISIESRLCGMFNVYNCLGCAVVAKLFGISNNFIQYGIGSIVAIEGRNQTYVSPQGVTVVVDFAHTPDGVRNILSFLKSTCKGKLIVVFGCGGNRDKFKRAVIGGVVSFFSDLAIITSDNPRYEKPSNIAHDIEVGMSCNYEIILDRTQAIIGAFDKAKKDDCIAILGKGAELYQEIHGIKIPFSDNDVVQKIIHSKWRYVD